MHYEISVSFAGFLLCSLCGYIFNVLPIWKINLYMSVFDWLRINNKYDIWLANRLAEGEFFKFFLTKEKRLSYNR